MSLVPVSKLIKVAQNNHHIAVEAQCPNCGGVAFCERGCKMPREYDPTKRESARRKLEALAGGRGVGVC